MNKLFIYNNKYKIVNYKGSDWRLYDELSTNSIDAFLSETQVALIDLIVKNNFKVFYIKCEPKSNFKISFIEKDFVDLKNPDTISIKKLLSSDLYQLYSNYVFEVLYKIPKVSKQGQYYYDMVLVVNQYFDLNNFYKFNFNLINIASISEITLNDITFDWVESFFKSRVIFNNRAPIDDYCCFPDYYNISKLELSHEEYIKNYNNGEEEFDLDHNLNISTKLLLEKFNQNLYAKDVFMLLDFQVLSLDKYCYLEKNKSGFCISYIEMNNLDYGFLTNFDELVGGTSIAFDNDNKMQLNKENYTLSSLWDNNYENCIFLDFYSKKAIKTGFEDISDLIVLSFEESKKIRV